MTRDRPPRLEQRLAAEGGGEGAEREPCIEIGPADPVAGRGEHVRGPVRTRPALRPEPHEGQVRGAAAGIDDEHAGFPVEGHLVGVAPSVRLFGTLALLESEP